MIDKALLLASKVAQTINTQEINLPNKNAPQGDSSFLSGQVESILQIVFVTMGAISVLIIALAGFQYITSGGDPQKTARAKDTILYAVIGLAVAISAFVIVTFVLGRIFG